MGRPVYCESCDYALDGLLEPGGCITCPECGKQAVGRWLPRRVRVMLAVVIAISPLLLLIAGMFVGPPIAMVLGRTWAAIFSTLMGLLALGGMLFPPAAAWWLWRKSGRTRVDMIDIACLVPVGWVLNLAPIFFGLAAAL